MLDDLVCLPWRGEIYRLGDVTLRVLVADGGAPGAWTLVEYSVPPQFTGPPRYVLPQSREIFYVLSGTLEVVVGEEAVSAPAGSCVVVPPGQAHTFHNREPVPVSFLIWLGAEGPAQHLDMLENTVIASVSPHEYTGERPRSA